MLFHQVKVSNQSFFNFEDKLDKNFLAIKAVHEQLDDDKDGEIDLEESSEVLLLIKYFSRIFFWKR